MKKTTSKMFALGILSILVFSCSDEANDVSMENSRNEVTKLIEVAKMGDFIANDPKTRAILDESRHDMPILHFESQEIFDATANQLKDMDINDRVIFLEELGFESACVKLKNADDELDLIFDIEDDNQFLNAYEIYKRKLNNEFVFNSIDEYDLSPYLNFTDEKLELLGNSIGYVAIADRLVSPTRDFPTFIQFEDETNCIIVDENQSYYIPPVLPKSTLNVGEMQGDYRGLSNASIMIKKGKYQSTMSIGYEYNIFRERLAVRFASQKKKKLWKRRHQTTYKARLEITADKLSGYSLFDTQKAFEEVKIPILDAPLDKLGKNFTAKIIDFSSRCCEDEKGNKTLSINVPFNP